MKTKDYRKSLLKRLEDSEFAVGYLTDVLAEESPEAFLIALRDVIDARQESTSSIAADAGITRQALYQALSEDGNPRFSTITQILKSLDFQFAGLKQVKTKRRKQTA